MAIIVPTQRYSGLRAAPATALRAWRLACNLVWPVACAGCGEPDVEICARCRRVIHGPAFRARPPGWPPGWGVWTASAYRGVPARLVIAWKERGRHDLTPVLAEGLAVALRAARAALPEGRNGVGVRSVGTGERGWLLVPVPSSRAARRRRGSDLMADLVRRAARECRAGWPGAPPRVVRALRHERRVRDQADLNAVQRRANLAGALGVRPAMVGP